MTALEKMREMLVQAPRLGGGDAEILQTHPSLRAEDLINACAYYHAHKAPIDRQIAENEVA